MSFLRDYLTYAAENEAPRVFHQLAGLQALSCALGRRAWVPFGNFAIYPNLYILFVGDAGNGKSWAMNHLDLLLKSAFSPTEVPMSANVETPAGLWTSLYGKPDQKPVPIPGLGQPITTPDGRTCESHPCLIKANELVNFISVDPKNWCSHLNDIYDQNLFIYKTLNSGSNILTEPYICLVGGVTTEFLQDLQELKIIGSGFARRTLFQYGEKDYANPRPRLIVSPEQKVAMTRCIAHLKAVRSVAGEFKFLDETWVEWDTWYRGNSAELPRRAPQLRGWYNSKQDQVLKLSMLFSLSERFDRVVEPVHLKLALAQLEVLESTLYRIFGGMGRNDLSEVAFKIYNYLAGMSEPVAKKSLYLKFWQSLPRRRAAQQEFDECLTFLTSDEKIKQIAVGVGTGAASVVDIFTGLPEVIDSFVAKHAGALDKLQHATQPASLLGTQPSTGPSTAPALPPASKSPTPPSVVPPPSGTLTDPSQTNPVN